MSDMNQEYSRPVSEIISLRHSVRNYTDQVIPEETCEKIRNYISTVENPFHKKVRIQLIQKDKIDDKIKLGTYGVIRGAKYYFVTACESDPMSYAALGYALEKVVLYCTSLGLGTVWLGGTFQKSQFAKLIGLHSNEVLPIVCPVGYEGGKRTLLGSFFQKSSNLRNPFSELFREYDSGALINENEAGHFAEPLEQLRLAPSAINKQPWRAAIEGDNVHFYLESTGKLNYVDLGIGLAHFHLSARELGINGEFVINQDMKQKEDKYQISFLKK